MVAVASETRTARNYRGAVEKFGFELLHMENNPQNQEDLALALSELIKLMRENARHDAESDLAKRHGSLAKQIKINIWSIAVLAGTIMLSVGALYQRVATLENQAAQNAVAASVLTEVRVRQDSFQTEMRRQLDRLEAELDHGKSGK